MARQLLLLPGAVLSDWWVGLLAGALVALVALRPRLRLLITIGAPLALAVCALYVIVQQHRHHYPSDLDWPPDPGELGEELSRLRWYRWEPRRLAGGWHLHLAVEDPEAGWSAALAAEDRADQATAS